MSLAASIISSTLNAGTPLLIAAVGIIIHEKSGVLNLGIEGIMLMGAVSGFAVTHATGSFELGFLAGMGVGLLLGLLFAFFTIGLRANQYAAGLLHGAVGLRRPVPAGRRASRPRSARHSGPRGHSVPRRGVLLPALARLCRACDDRGRLVLPLQVSSRPHSPSRRRVSRICIRARLSRAPHPLLGRALRCHDGGACGRLPLARLHAALGRGHGCGPRLDRTCARHVRHLASRARARRRLPLRRRHDASVRGSGHGHRHRAAVHGHDATSRRFSCWFSSAAIPPGSASTCPPRSASRSRRAAKNFTWREGRHVLPSWLN